MQGLLVVAIKGRVTTGLECADAGLVFRFFCWNVIRVRRNLNEPSSDTPARPSGERRVLARFRAASWLQMELWRKCPGSLPSEIASFIFCFLLPTVRGKP